MIVAEHDRVALDPNAQVQRSLRMLFDTFACTGAATATAGAAQSALRGGLRVRAQPAAAGRCRRVAARPIGEWTVLLREAHPGYIAWDIFQANQRRLRDKPRVVARIGSLLDSRTDAEIAALLNESGVRTGRPSSSRAGSSRNDFLRASLSRNVPIRCSMKLSRWSGHGRVGTNTA